jgi:hypothetical protein
VLLNVHHYFGFFVAASNLIVGGWGIVRHRRKLPSIRAFWIGVGVAWISVFLQGLMGLSLFHKYKPPFKHTFYGFLFVVVMLFVWPLRGESDRTRQLVFAIGTLFIGIVAVRAIFSYTPQPIFGLAP